MVENRESSGGGSTGQIKHYAIHALSEHSGIKEKRKSYLCTFSIAATSARAAKLKNADTAGISDVIL